MPLRRYLLLIAAAAAVFAESPPALTVFETRCLSCHSGKSPKGGLDLSTRESLLRGGGRGPAIVSGDAKVSLLYQLVSHAKEPHMPFGSPKLPGAEIDSLAAWIDHGAVFQQPQAAKAPTQLKSDHWAFQVPTRPLVPSVKNAASALNPIDAFLEAERAKRGLAPLPAADRRTLFRRIYLDLIGVPPMRDEMRTFLADNSPNAYDKAVDRLLADSRYGERWGRHWMDVWRYSDWYGWRKGNDVRNSTKFIWRWRDWIIESLNTDKGYDRMILEMLAADELTPNDPKALRATGYLARSFAKYDRHGWMQDAVDHTAMAFLGITLKCARCHDHKYDPFTQEEYYQFRAFFEPYQVRTDRVPGQPDTEKDGLARVFDENPSAETFLLIRGDIQNPDKDHPLAPVVPSVLRGAPLKRERVPLNLEAYYPDYRDFVHADLIAQAKADIEAAEAELAKSPGPVAEKTLAAAKAALPALEARIRAEKAKYSGAPDAESLAEAARKAERDAGILKAAENILRAHLELTEAGNDEKKIGAAQKRLTAAQEALKQHPDGYTPIGKAYPETSSGRRLALARWVASRENPLTARVAVNHIWLRHFGRAIVPSVADFGKNGRPPSHPQLLDWLATEFMESGWSMKRIHRFIVTSQAYRMRSSSGETDHPNAKVDPENIYLWRMNSHRMEAEVVRDSMLAVSGQLDSAVGGPEISQDKIEETRRRSIYLPHTPDISVQFLKTFDSASPIECYERNESVVPHQALAMSNSKLSRDQARILAKSLFDEGQAPGSFVDDAFETILARPPSKEEKAAGERFLLGSGAAAREDFVHVLLNHNDFVTIR